MEFCQRLGRLDGHAYRLPTEAEWEYACRAGTQSPFFWGDIISTDLVNHDGNYTYGRGTRGAYRERPVPAGSLPPNVFGLHEMHGNVWEWCLDWYAEYMGPATDPTGPVEGTSHVLRGGSWYAVPAACRSAKRASNATDGPAGRVGCRVVVALPGGLP
jgi:formylglycine-generating enzyme required for sulfatase activity